MSEQGSNASKGSKRHNFDIDNCVRDASKSMSSPNECYQYVMGKLSSKTDSRPEFKNITGKDVREFCQIVTDRTSVGFYQELCQGKSKAYSDAFSGSHKPDFSI